MFLTQESITEPIHHTSQFNKKLHDLVKYGTTNQDTDWLWAVHNINITRLLHTNE